MIEGNATARNEQELDRREPWRSMNRYRCINHAAIAALTATSTDGHCGAASFAE
jgi:hypothetical protein